MMATRRRPLTAPEWRSIADLCREAVAIMHRVGTAMGRIRGAGALVNRWGALRNRLEHGAFADLVDLASGHLGVPPRSAARMFEPPDRMYRGPDDPLRLDYRWPSTDFDLNRSRWVEIGDDVKRLHAIFRSLDVALQPALPLGRRRRWHRFDMKVVRCKCSLDGFVYRENHDWPEFCRVFFGPPSAVNPPLLASLGPELAVSQ